MSSGSCFRDRLRIRSSWQIRVYSDGIIYEDGLPDDDLIFGTDVGDNSVKVFSPFRNFNIFFYAGEQVGQIQGKHTKLKRPEGVAVNLDGDTLYVVNNNSSTLSMFTGFGEGGGDIAPTLMLSGSGPKMNFPVDVALPAFTASPKPTGSTTKAN